jgi:hypothetical protein
VYEVVLCWNIGRSAEYLLHSSSSGNKEIFDQTRYPRPGFRDVAFASPVSDLISVTVLCFHHVISCCKKEQCEHRCLGWEGCHQTQRGITEIVGRVAGGKEGRRGLSASFTPAWVCEVTCGLWENAISILKTRLPASTLAEYGVCEMVQRSWWYL